MVLVDAAIAWRDKKKAQWAREATERVQAAKVVASVKAVAQDPDLTNAEAFAKAYGMGLEQGRAEAHQTWRDWYARFADAKARGVPFDEAPPSP